MSTVPAAADPRPRRRRVWLPLFLLMIFVALAGLFVAALVRGEWADTIEKNPAAPQDDPVTQLYRKSNGNVVVRSAVVVAAPPKDVWAVVRAYSKYGEFLPGVRDVEATPQQNDRVQLAGVFHARLFGAWPFECVVKHVEAPPKGEFAAFWNEHDFGEFALNRGSWSVSPLDKTQRQSLLTCTLQIECKDWPNFIVRDVLLYELPPIVQAMRDEVVRGK